MTIDNIYGINSTDEVQYDRMGLPIGQNQLVMVIGEEAANDDKGVVMELEILDGEHKGKKGKVWILSKHENQQTANIAKQTLKRIAEASGSAVTPTAPLKGRVFRIDVREQKKNPDYTEVAKYWPENHTVDAEVPL